MKSVALYYIIILHNVRKLGRIINALYLNEQLNRRGVKRNITRLFFIKKSALRYSFEFCRNQSE